MSVSAALSVSEAFSRRHELTVIDVRTPGEFASGHLPDAVNVPLDRIGRALPDLRQAAEHGPLLVVCASGTRSENAVATLVSHGIDASSLTGGTAAWAAEGYLLDRPEGRPRAVWAMERQVRFTAGSVVLLGLALGFLLHPAFQLLSAGIAAGLVFSALSNTCGMAVVLGALPFNRRGKAALNPSFPSASVSPEEPRA
ncbi:rhodanese-like domain-containing protein [Streptomyces sp. NBC_01565]|uniref:rhodanese-like domain-containing protein n=1 Tax=unclassified Streptomyces TaxID=2593676 RepID=UPI00225A286D|nr:rhodanese-like domain-containing protein [Streptomyces sp. NBC_01565]MCX4547099.1 rhodanese-like domain-containing protein [Streptomyces sp. NBC_01565]